MGLARRCALMVAFVVAAPAWAQVTTLPPLAAPRPEDRPLPITLATALQLADASPLDVEAAAARVRVATAQWDKAKALWLPSVSIGADYFRHDGQLQDIVGNVFTTSRSAFMLGVGPNAVFSVGDALYAPLAARQVTRARQEDAQAVRNDAALATAEAYFAVQQARGELAGAADAVLRTQLLVERTDRLAEGYVPDVEKSRVRAELARRRQAAESAYERWQVASAELHRILRLNPTTLTLPAEPPELRIDLVDASAPIDDLVTQALRCRPELASQQALVEATLTRLKQEKIRPLVPSLLLRGTATNPAGTLSSGYFGGGVNSHMSHFSARNSYDVQLIWELQNLGLGNRAAVREKQADAHLATLHLFRVQDQIAADVVKAHAQVRRAGDRIALADEGVRHARTTAERCVEGVSQTRRVGDTLILVLRPQEVVASIQALDQAYRDYYGAVADVNRAQFRLFRALGRTNANVGEASGPLPEATGAARLLPPTFCP